MGYTSRKTYLSQQIRLVSLATYDLFTETEQQLYTRVIEIMNDIERVQTARKKGGGGDPDEDAKRQNDLVAEKKATQEALAAEIRKHADTPRTVRLSAVLNLRKYTDDEGEIHLPPGVTWNGLKISKRIAEFCSEESRALGLQHLDITWDKIIVKWKSLDVLEQIVRDGFDMPILHEDGTVEVKHYICQTASAGQLRTDKVQFLEEKAWQRIQGKIQCGLDWDTLNSKGGINVNKLMAYTALPCSATDPWDMDIDRCIVIPDFIAPVTGQMKFLKPDYSSEIGEHTVMINHCDGCGMMLPSVSEHNFMVRGPWLKGLLASMNFLRFCEVNGVPPKIRDFWGQEHDLVAEDIQIIFTESQLKLAKYYSSWDEYKRIFKENGCSLSRTNFEEDFIPDTTINYQMLQTLTDFTDEEINQFTRSTYNKIKSIADNKNAMLRTLNAELDADNPYHRALYMYPELLREAYSRETLKAIKKKWTMDAKSGRIKCQNKRLFVIPDLYAACEYWFMGIKEPQGLLKDGEVFTKVYRNYDEADILRSPHLACEHTIRTIIHDPDIGEWFSTNGIYTSCHDMISRVLQFDCDGDQLNVVVDPVIVKVAKRNLEKYDVLPLYYDMSKAPAELLSRETMFRGLKRAHDFSGIGAVSNNLTKLWNRDEPDREAAEWLCMYNNFVIDAAKTGFVNSYEAYPKINKRINRATGGKAGRMPYFFQYSKNGRKNLSDRVKKKKSYAKPNGSTMNRICKRFETIGNIRMDYAGVAPFNWQMLMPGPCPGANPDAVALFCQMDDGNLGNVIAGKDMTAVEDKEETFGYDILRDEIIHELCDQFGSIEAVYPYITKELFGGDGADKQSHKQMYWRVFGELAVETLQKNLQSCSTCPSCGMKYPAWMTGHICPKQIKGFYTCVDCGNLCQRTYSRQCRCVDCQTAYRNEQKRQWFVEHYKAKSKKKR